MQETAKPYYRANVSFDLLRDGDGKKLEHIVLYFHKEQKGKSTECLVIDQAVAVKLAKDILSGCGELYMTSALRHVMNVSPDYSVTAKTVSYEKQLESIAESG